MDRLGVLLIRGLIAVLAWMPHLLVIRLGRLAADASFALRIRREIIFRQLDHVYGDRIDRAQKQRIARSANRNIFLTVLEMLRAAHPRATDEVAGYLEYKPQKLAESLSREPPGVLFVVAHSGNFDLGAIHWIRNYPRAVSVVMKPLKSQRFNEFLVETRERYGTGVLSAKGHVLFRMRERLGRGECVCILPDQYARSRGVVVDFLGKPASTHKGAALAALGSPGARIVVGVDTRVDDGPYHQCFLTEVDFQPSGDDDADVEVLTQRLCDVMAQTILDHPGSYFWQHNRWGYPGAEIRGWEPAG